jgi:hypothetical protein
MRFWASVGRIVHFGLLAVAGGVVVAATTEVNDAPLRWTLVGLVAFLAVVSLLGRAPRGLGPVDDTIAARGVRWLGFALAGLGVWGLVLTFWAGDVDAPVVERTQVGIPLLGTLLALCFAAVLAATRRGSVLRGRVLIQTVAAAASAVLVWTLAVLLMPPAGVGLGVALVAVAAIVAAALASRQPGLPAKAPLAGLLAVVIATQLLLATADALFRLGPDAWIPDAGPGPLTPQAHLEQNRLEAIDPYVGLLAVGAMAGVALIGMAVVSRRLARGPATFVTAIRA